MKNYQEIKNEKEIKVNQLIVNCRMFFAFSDKQFAEGKTELTEGEKYLSLGAGAYMPKFQLENWKSGIEKIDLWQKGEVQKSKLEEQEILYELSNHECFYTGDCSDIFDMFSGKYTETQIMEVFKKHKKQYQESF